MKICSHGPNHMTEMVTISLNVKKNLQKSSDGMTLVYNITTPVTT